MVLIYSRMLSAIDKILCDLVQEYQGMKKFLQNLVEDQKRNMAQLVRIGAVVN